MADTDVTNNFLDVKVNPADANLDIVAVHGLNPFGSGSNAYSTWTAEVKKQERNWLTDEDVEGFLPKTLPTARVMIFGYNSNAVFESSNATVNEHAKNLLTFLRQKRRQLDPPGRPLIFICHSLGGLLVKRAIVMAYNTDLYREIYNCTRGFVFFATPQGGSDKVGVGNIAATVARTLLHKADQRYLDALSKNSLCAETNRQDFLQRTKDFAFISIIESKKTKGVEVVAKSDSVLGLPDDQERKITLDTDHVAVCKFWDPKSRAFEHVKDEIVEMAENAVQSRGRSVGVPANDGGAFRTPFSLLGVPAWNNFVDRPSDTADLERCLLPQRLRARQNQRRKIFILYGLGGIGKTQLAVDFSRRHQTTFSSIFWLDGRSEDRLKQSIAGCASRIPEGQIPDRSRNLSSSDDLDAVVRDVMDWLARPDNADWLLVFDNVDQDPEQGGGTGAYDLRQYLPSDHGSVLITTRMSRLAQLGDSKQLTKVDEDLAKAIFQKWYGSELDSNGEELRALLDGLPLALAQAASYLHETGLDLATYVQLYKQQWDDLMRYEESGSPLLDYEQRSVGTTWMISFKAIEAESRNAANLLLLWAFLDNKQLWHGLLEAAEGSGEVREHWPRWLREIACNKVKFLNAIRLLLRYSMIEAQEALKGSYGMHPVVQRWTSYIQDSRQKGEFLRLAVMVVGFSVPKETTKEYWTVHRRLLPHAERCSWWMLKEGEILGGDKGHFDDDLVMRAIHLLGILYYRQGKLKEAEEMYLRALEGKEKTLGRDHTSTLRTVHNLGNVYADQDRLKEAEEMYLRALEGKEKVLAPDNMSTLDTVNNLGNLYADQDRLEKAEETYLRALDGKEKTLGRDHTSTLQTVHNLGNLYYRQGKSEKAKEMYLRALEGREKAFERDHTSTLDTVNNLGNLYADLDRLEKAEEMYLRALEGKEKALGRDHTSTLQTVHNLGSLYYRQGKSEKAKEMYLRALEGREKAPGRDHTSTLRTVHNLGNLYYEQNELKEAEEMYLRALEGKEMALGRDHTSTLQTVYNLGVLYCQQGRLEEAKEMYLWALEGREKAPGRGHTSTLDMVGMLSRLLKEKLGAEYDFRMAELVKGKARNADGTVALTLGDTAALSINTRDSPPDDAACVSGSSTKPAACTTRIIRNSKATQELDIPVGEHNRNKLIIQNNVAWDRAIQINAPIGMEAFRTLIGYRAHKETGGDSGGTSIVGAHPQQIMGRKPD